MTLLPQASCRPGETPEARGPAQLQRRVLETGRVADTGADKQMGRQPTPGGPSRHSSAPGQP